ncbi:MAG: nuclear transport factor 2 family protein [Massilia sp.]
MTVPVRRRLVPLVHPAVPFVGTGEVDGGALDKVGFLTDGNYQVPISRKMRNMKKILLSAVIAASLVPAFAAAQGAPQGWEAEVRQFDQVFWDAYNKCDIKKLLPMTLEELEFYHDQGGEMIGRKAFESAMEKNICGNPQGRRVRREAIADSVHVYPMMAGGKLYGAVMEGNHQFYGYGPGAPESLQDRARFTHLLLLESGVWKVARVLSYDHKPVQLDAALAEVQLAPAALDALGGQYKAKDGMAISVSRSGNHLLALAGGAKFDLYPTGENNFAMKGRDIRVAFSVNAAGKGQGLVVRERGSVVAEATVVAP